MLSKFKLLVLIAIALSLSIFSHKALGEIFTVHGNASLNTKEKLELIEDRSWMSIDPSHKNNPKQELQYINDNRSGSLLKHGSTGNCLNDYSLVNAAELNILPCNPNNSDGNLLISDVGNSDVEIKPVDTNLCVDASKGENKSKLPLWECFQNRYQPWKTIGIDIASRKQSSSWKLPWRKGVKGIVTQRWHSDGWSKRKSFDIGLPAGTPVLAPIDSKVLQFCNAGNNHLSIRLQSWNGKRYTLIHVKSSTVSRNKKYKKGQKIGVIAGDTPWNRCAKSTGPHLHFSLPKQNFTIGRYNLSPSFIPKSLTPRN
ncbi:MAG: peptidoglycan DD-metalloendopeptidase family protein [Cyanobacteria bacterium J06635_10]